MDNSVSGKEDSTVHYLPCKIEHSGTADVSSYFLIDDKADGSLSARFRGRGLQGEVLELSKHKPMTTSGNLNMRGLVVARDSNNTTHLEIEGQFDKMHVWQHDRKPEIHEVTQFLEHLEVAQAIHEM